MAALTNTLPTESLKTPNGELPKIINGELPKIINPHLTNVKTRSGKALRIYQLELCNKILDDFKKGLDDPKHLKTIEKYFRILQMDTGTGKTFLVEYLIDILIQTYIQKTNIRKGTIVIMAPRTELLSDFVQIIETCLVKGLNDDGIKTKLYTSLKMGYNCNDNIHTFDPNLDAMKIVIITDQINIRRDISDKINDLLLAIRDEGLGLDSADADVAKEYDKIYNAGLKFHDKFNGMPTFKLVLNATPSESQIHRKSIKEQFIYSYDKTLLWMKPIAGKVIHVPFKDVKDKKAKKHLVDIATENFIQRLLTINYNEQYGKENNLEIPLKLLNVKPTCINKADPKRYDYHWDVNKIVKFINDKDDLYSRENKKFKIKNFVTGEEVEIEYPGANILGGQLLHPVISDKSNNYNYANLTDPDNKENCLVVCEKGGMGINVAGFINELSVRPAERPKGRKGGLAQYKGRMDRNPFLTDHDCAEIIKSVKITGIGHYNLIMNLMLQKMVKDIYEPNTTQNHATAQEWLNKNDNYDNKKIQIEKILIDNGYSISFQKKVMGSTGSTKSFTYDDFRLGNSKCEVEGCKQIALEELKRIYMEEEGKSEIEANYLAVKGALQNAHVLNKDGEIVLKCTLHHIAETETKQHWREKNDKKRIA